VVRVLLYVSSTVDYGLTFHPGVVELHAYVDSSFNVYHDGKAHYGCCYMLGHGDAAFYSVSKRMKVQPLSSTEAEYVAFCECGRDCSYFNRLLVELGLVRTSLLLYTRITSHVLTCSTEDRDIRQVNTLILNFITGVTLYRVVKF